VASPTTPRLKVAFAGSQELAEESKKFIMVNAEDEEEPHDDATYNVDGGYIPRLFFLTPNGERTEVFNEAGNAAYKYYYWTTDQILAAMSRALSAGGASASTPNSKEL
jgi:protein-disulfide reductase (glutathione)